MIAMMPASTKNPQNETTPEVNIRSARRRRRTRVTSRLPDSCRKPTCMCCRCRKIWLRRSKSPFVPSTASVGLDELQGKSEENSDVIPPICAMPVSGALLSRSPIRNASSATSPGIYRCDLVRNGPARPARLRMIARAPPPRAICTDADT